MPRPSADAKLETVRDLMGKKPDHEIAAMIGVSISTVGKFRRKNNIPAYEGHKFIKGKVGTPGRPTSAPSRKKKTTSPGKKKKRASGKKRFRRSKLDAFKHLVGKIPDREVAEMAGMTPDGVRMYRHRHGIPAVSTYRKTQQKQPEAAPAASPAPATSPAPAAGARAYTVTIRAGGSDKEYIVLAGDIVQAARRTTDALSARGGGEVLSLRFLAEALG